MIDDEELTCHKCGARRNCNSEVFELKKPEEVSSTSNENNGIIECCKCFITKWRQRR